MTDREKATVFLDYSERQNGVIPVSLAAVLLRITPQGVCSAIHRQKISALKWKGNFYCGRKSVDKYRWHNSSKFKDNANFTLEYLIDLDEEGESITL